MNLLNQNPYRILGVLTNSSTKERVANQSKAQAFLKVGKPVSSPLDLPEILPPLTRTPEAIEKAMSQLSLPHEQLRFAQFWLVKVTAIDDIALEHLYSGNIKKATDIWSKKKTISSLHNSIVCALMQAEYTTAITLFEELYSYPYQEIATTLVGDGVHIDTHQMAQTFLDSLCEEIDVQLIIPHLRKKEWRQYLSERTIQPLIDELLAEVGRAKKANGVSANLRAGQNLMMQAKSKLPVLRELLSESDMQYQVVADEVGLQILQCGINYYNGSEALDAAPNAMRLQRYAHSIVMGQTAKTRCKENLDILEKIIAKLPPREILEEHKKILELVKKETDMILCIKIRPLLDSARIKLGVTHLAYLELSTLVCRKILNDSIERINTAQNNYMYILRDLIEKEWEILSHISGWAMTPEFRVHFQENYNTLENICSNLGIHTGSPVPNPRSQPTPSPKPKPSPRPNTGTHVDSNQTDSDENWGCFIIIAIAVIILIITQLIK